MSERSVIEIKTNGEKTGERIDTQTTANTLPLAPNCVLNLCEECVNGADAIIEPKFTDSAYLDKGANRDLGLDGGDGGGAAPLLPVLCVKRRE